MPLWTVATTAYSPTGWHAGTGERGVWPGLTTPRSPVLRSWSVGNIERAGRRPRLVRPILIYKVIASASTLRLFRTARAPPT